MNNNHYLYFSFYNHDMECIGYNIIPTEKNASIEWVIDNVTVPAPSDSCFCVVSLETSPPAELPIWIEILGMENIDGPEN